MVCPGQNRICIDVFQVCWSDWVAELHRLCLVRWHVRLHSGCFQPVQRLLDCELSCEHVNHVDSLSTSTSTVGTRTLLPSCQACLWSFNQHISSWAVSSVLDKSCMLIGWQLIGFRRVLTFGFNFSQNLQNVSFSGAHACRFMESRCPRCRYLNGICDVFLSVSKNLCKY